MQGETLETRLKNPCTPLQREIRRVLRPGGRLLLTTDYDDAGAEIWYHGAGPRFRVDGATDLSADWERLRPLMLEFHGYPYASIGLALAKI
ncbi:MAG: hypothetical protein AB1640_15075 [bacterium]